MEPLVSINVVTYNHKNYIEQCLEGILMQQTTFPFEIILGEDESSDGTREICMDYANRYPDKIRLFLRSRKDVICINGKATGRYNMIQCLKASKGKYIALCEGDDYWTDPLKLQKQVDFLEANDDYVICFHKVKILKDNELVDDFITEERFSKIKTRPITELDLFKYSNFIHTPSVMFKNIIDQFPVGFELSPVGDYFLYFMLTKHGYIHRIEEDLAVYRYGNGIYSALSESQKSILGRQFQLCLLSYASSNEIKKDSLTSLLEYIKISERNNINNYTVKQLAVILLKSLKRKFLNVFRSKK